MTWGIIGAMESEVALLKEKMELEKTEEISGLTYHIGTLAGQKVIVVMCSVGKVNAAMCTQILCACFAVTHIINTGVAGSLCAELDIGDFVISSDAIYHDFDLHFWGMNLHK